MSLGGSRNAICIAVGRKSQAAQGKSLAWPGGNFARPMRNHRHAQAAVVKVAADAAKRSGALEKFRVNAAVHLRPGVAGEENHRVACQCSSFCNCSSNWPM